MTWGALIYGYAAKANNITQMPQVNSDRDKSDHDEDIHPIEWAMDHHKYGRYVHVEDEQLWYSDKVVFGYCVGVAGEELTLENIGDAQIHADDISEAVKFFTGLDTDISDYGYHVCTMFDE